jgi:hypothetical protein
MKPVLRRLPLGLKVYKSNIMQKFTGVAADLKIVQQVDKPNLSTKIYTIIYNLIGAKTVNT